VESGCLCVSHVASRAWLAATGDSYVVWAEHVYSAAGAGSYLGKYLVKSFGTRCRLKELGYERRFVCSRNWPSPGPLKMRGTVMETWDSVRWSKKERKPPFVVERDGHPLGAPAGDDLAVALNSEVDRTRRLKELECLLGIGRRPFSVG